MFLVAWRDETVNLFARNGVISRGFLQAMDDGSLLEYGRDIMYLAFELDFFFILAKRQQPRMCSWGLGKRTLYGAYHFASRVFPLQHVNHVHAQLSRKKLNLLPVLDEDK